MYLIKLFLCFPIFFVMACSAAYKEIKEIDVNNPKTFHEHLVYNYQQNASFEAEKMHDWNAVKLYSEKALRALKGENVYPEKITYWKISEDKITNIKSGYDNLISIYEEALIKDPINLAKAISSLDCWAEQEEEKWQTWDIEKCMNNFHKSMHNIYNNILRENENENNKKETLTKKENQNTVTIVSKKKKKELIQIIYFDFDNSLLSEVSRIKLENFLEKNIETSSRFIIFGHTDTKGTNYYNLNLSVKRAESVKKILLKKGISEKKISVHGKGENELAITTPDNTKHPANRRAEVKILN